MLDGMFSFLRREKALALCLFSPVISLHAFEILSFEVNEVETTIVWQGGNPPYQLQVSDNLSDWNDFGAEQSATRITLPTSASGRQFFRVTFQPDPEASEPIDIASGTFEVPQFTTTSDPNYHTVRTFRGQLPAGLSETAGRRLTIELFDVNNPDLSCDFQHPLGGCTTIDWDDFQSAANVPPSGYFDNSFTATFGGVERRLFLRTDLSMSLANNSHPIG